MFIVKSKPNHNDIAGQSDSPERIYSMVSEINFLQQSKFMQNYSMTL